MYLLSSQFSQYNTPQILFFIFKLSDVFEHQLFVKHFLGP